MKAGWGLAGGVLLLLTIFGQRVFPIGGSDRRRASACSTARAASARRSVRSRCAGFSDSSRARLRRTIGPAYLHGRRVLHRARRARRRSRVAALCVLLRAFRRIDPVGVQHGARCSSKCPDRFRGRVFAAGARTGHADVIGVELLDRLRSSIAAGWSPRTLSLSLGAMFCVPGALAADSVALARDTGRARSAAQRRRGRRVIERASDRRVSASTAILNRVDLPRDFRVFHRALHQLLRVVELFEHERDVHLGLPGKPFAAAVDAVLARPERQ